MLGVYGLEFGLGLGLDLGLGSALGLFFGSLVFGTFRKMSVVFGNYHNLSAAFGNHCRGEGAPAFPTPAIETIGLG